MLSEPIPGRGANLQVESSYVGNVDRGLELGPQRRDLTDTASSRVVTSALAEFYTTSGAGILPAVTGTVGVQSVSQTWCNVAVESAPSYNSDGRLYRQGITPTGRAPSVLPAPSNSVDVERLLNQYLTGVATTADGFQRSNRMRIEQPSLYRTNVHHAYARGATGRGVSIAIEDAPVDILSWDLRGRVQQEGAEYLFQQFYAFQRADAGIAFGHCDTADEAIENDCSVWEINAGGDDRVVNAYGRYLIEQFGYPDKENTWWIRDTSEGEGGAWYEIPALFDCGTYTNVPGYEDEDFVPCQKYNHGTRVATVAAGWTYGAAPGARVVPLPAGRFEDPFDTDRNDSYFASLGFWDRVRAGLYTASERQVIGEFWVASRASEYANFDIINRSFGASISPLSSNAFGNEEAWRTYFPVYWREVQQLNTTADDRVIEVYAAGNDGETTDPNLWGYPSGTAARPYRYSAFRGHHIAAMAVDENGAETEYTNRCGSLPSDWNTMRDGRHYCVAAPGDIYGISPGWRSGGSQSGYDRLVSGTSYAAPIVAGSLALLMEYFTDANGNRQLGNREIALRLINTANNTGIYSDASIYGAGLIDLDAATRPVGTASVGDQSISAPVHRTIALLPAAYGDVGGRLKDTMIATFDEWNAPFFQSAATLFMRNASPPRHSLPLSLLPVRPDLAVQALGLSRNKSAGESTGVSLVGGRHSIGAVWSVSKWLEFGALADSKSDQGSIVQGAMGEKIRSGLLWGEVGHAHRLGDQVSLWAVLSGGTTRSEYKQGMLDIGAATFSAWEVGARMHNWRVSVAQPWRAESGTGSLSYTSGRERTGNRLYASQRFSLEPTGREVALRAQYQLELAETTVAMEVQARTDAGHVAGEREATVGVTIGWRW